MKELADFLERLDSYFEDKSTTERLAMILLPAAVVGFFAWYTLNPPATAAHNQSTAKNKQAEKRLREDKNYLKSITVNGDRNHHVKAYDKKIGTAKQQVESYRKRIAMLDKNLYKLSDMLFNKKSWSNFLDSITARARENNVIIRSVSNRYVDGNGSFGHVLEMSVQCRGDFPGIVAFMNDLEQNTLVTDIFNSNIYTEANSTQVRADINISVWGVNH